MNIVGINSSGTHESGACLLRDGELVFACAEERLSRKKQDSAFPVRAIQAALDFGGLKPSDVDHVAFSWPRPREVYAHDLKLLFSGQWPASAMRWQRLALGLVKAQHHRGGELDYLRAFWRPKHSVHFTNHHLSHALSAYCLSGFDEAAVLVVDGRGAREATTLWHAAGDQLRCLEQYDFPNSIGVFYGGITEMLGFQPLSDEWKVMGLASYGNPTVDLSRLIRCREDTYWVDGRRLPPGSPTAAMAAGIGLVPEDRRQQGLVMDFSIERNIALASLDSVRRAGLIPRAAERRFAKDWALRLQLKYGKLTNPAWTLSGGNQQKAVLAKWLARKPALLIVDEPTRGIDVGTKAEVHRLLSELAAQGVAVLMISSELPEVLGMADRIVVLFEGRVMREFARAEADEDALMHAATGQLEDAA